MKNRFVWMIVVLVAIILSPLKVDAQSQEQGMVILKQANDLQENARSKEQIQNALKKYQEALEIFEKLGLDRELGATLNNIAVVYNTWGQYPKALEYYEKSLAKRQKVSDIRGEGISLNNIGLVYDSWGEFSKALDYYEQSVAITKKIGDAKQEAATLNNIASVYHSRGQYPKALEYFEHSLSMMRKIGDVNGQGFTLADIGKVYNARGEYPKALEFYEQSLAIMRKVNDVTGEGNTLTDVGKLYVQTGKYQDAEKSMNQALEIFKRLGSPTSAVINDLADLYLETGDWGKAESLLKITNDNSSLGRFALLQSNYPTAIGFYEKGVTLSEKTGDVDSLFKNYTGLAKAHEGMENYQKAEEYYEKAMNLLEEIRSGFLPSERKNFFEVKVGGFTRTEPAKGLARVLMKLNRQDTGIEAVEVTKARAFADHLTEVSASGASGVPSETLQKEQSLVNRLATLKKELAKTDRVKQSGRHEILSKETQDSEADLRYFVDNLWKNNPAYAAVKYPRRLGTQESALDPSECVVMFDVSSSGVLIKLIRNKKETESFLKKWDSDDLERQVKKFREPFENPDVRQFDPELAASLYRKLLQAVLEDVPKGTPLIIIPDGILAVLPFEALVTGGKATWKKMEGKNWPKQLTYYPEGITFLGDDYPISYYQSLYALTLVRTIGNKEKPKDSLLVVADPVFNMTDQRAQQAGEARLSHKEKEYNIQRMAAMEDVAGPLFPQLPATGKMADNLARMYGTNCLSVTGLNADKTDFLSKIAPRLDQYGKVVFATHGVMGNKVPGVMEPFLALSMVPPGTDGFLKLTDIISLKMNADIVALTACQTGLGKYVSGEGVMSMGQSFQYAGARSVLMSLWSVADVSSVKLTESFFQHRKSGKSKLESLKLAREEIRKQGFEHPFFWAAFILVGETS